MQALYDRAHAERKLCLNWLLTIMRALPTKGRTKAELGTEAIAQFKKEALDAHGRGSWAAANTQIGTFLDALLDEIDVKLDPSAATVGSGQPRRTKLASQGFLSRELKRVGR